MKCQTMPCKRCQIYLAGDSKMKVRKSFWFFHEIINSFIITYFQPLNHKMLLFIVFRPYISKCLRKKPLDLLQRLKLEQRWKPLCSEIVKYVYMASWFYVYFQFFIISNLDRIQLFVVPFKLGQNSNSLRNRSES